MSVKVCHGEILEKDCLMPRIAGSPCPTDTERDVEDFLADMRELVAGSQTGPTFRKGMPRGDMALPCCVLQDMSRTGSSTSGPPGWGLVWLAWWRPAQTDWWNDLAFAFIMTAMKCIMDQT